MKIACVPGQEGYEVEIIGAKAGEELVGYKGREKVKADKGIDQVKANDYDDLRQAGATVKDRASGARRQLDHQPQAGGSNAVFRRHRRSPGGRRGKPAGRAGGAASGTSVALERIS
jgi:hypothetical protein